MKESAMFWAGSWRVVLWAICWTAAGASSDARADPVTDFIVQADSLAAAGGDEALQPYVEAHEILVGAVVGELLDVAFQIHDEDPSGAQENLALADRLAHLHATDAPRSLVEQFRGWTRPQRKRKAEAAALETAANEARDQGDLEAALQRLEEALALYQAIGDRRAEAILWGSLGVVHWYRGDMEKVRAAYETALEQRRAIEDRILEGRTLNGLGSVNIQTGQLDAAREAYEQAIELRRRTGDLSGLGTSLTYVSNVYLRQGQPLLARARLEEALPVLESTGRPQQLMEAYNTLGLMQSEMGLYGKAEASYRNVIELAGELERPDVAIGARLNLAQMLRERGAFRSALAQLDAVEPLLAAHPDSTLLTTFHGERGLSYLRLGDQDRARDDLVTATQIAATLADPAYRLDTLINLGAFYLEVGAIERALGVTDQARELAVAAGDDLRRRHVEALAGDAYRQLGDGAQAEEHWQWALDHDEEGNLVTLLPEDKFGLANALGAAGERPAARELYRDALRLYADLGNASSWGPLLGLGDTFETDDPDSAAIYYERALSKLEEARTRLTSSGDTGFYSLERGRVYEEVIRFYAEQYATSGNPAWSERAFATTERAKARGLLDLVEGAIHLEDDPMAAALLDTLYQIEGEDPGARQRRRVVSDQLAARRDDQVRAVVGSSVRTPTLDQVRRGLPKGAVLLQYALGDSSSHLWVVDAAAQDLVPLPPRAVLQREVRQLRDALATPGVGDARLRTTAHRLYEWLVAPAALRLDEATSLIVVPDGVLFELPFEVLLATDADVDWSQTSFLGRRWAPVYSPSSSVLLSLLQVRDEVGYGLDLLALGDADYAGLGLDLPPLPFSRAEVESIARWWDADHITLLLGTAANESALRHALTNHPRILHLATHGLIDAVEPSRSRLVMANTDRDDGFLYTLEIVGLPLQARLVVLSACESARGRVERAEGVVGLTRAFLAAGASNVVASLWPVADESTAALMDHFYTELVSERLSPAQALQAARESLLETEAWSHPFYWAPFVLIGADTPIW